MASAGHEQIVDVSRIERTVRNAHPASLVNVNAVVAPDPIAFGVVHVGAPIGKGDGIGMNRLLVVVALVHDVVAHQTARLAPTKEDTYVVDSIALGLLFLLPMILDIVNIAKGDAD